jgi:cytochrome c oxidase cbb3-type subunit 4
MEVLNDLVNHVLRPAWGVIVMVIFLGIGFWAYWPKNKGRFEEDGNIIFREDPPSEDKGKER